MTLEIVIDFISDMEEHIDIEARTSSCYNVINDYKPSSPTRFLALALLKSQQTMK